MESILYFISQINQREKKCLYKTITGVFPGHECGKMAAITVSVELNWPCASSGCSILIIKCFANKELRIAPRRHLNKKTNCYLRVLTNVASNI